MNTIVEDKCITKCCSSFLPSASTGLATLAAEHGILLRMNTEALENWKSKAKVFPNKFSSLEYSRDFTVEEYGKIAKGVIPLEMEDKWFIHLEDDTLNLYRSWTGHCI